MPKRRHILILLACGLAVVLYAILSIPREPSYKGKRLSEWIEIHGIVAHSMSDREEAGEAIRHIGTNGLPYLLAWIREPQQATWQIRLAKASEALPERLRPVSLYAYSARPFCASLAVGALGPAANNAIPELTRLANDTNDLDRARIAIGALGYLGAQAFPTLLALLTNQNKELCCYAARQMCYQGSRARPAIPVLVTYLSDQTMAETSANVLGRLALEPNLVVPALSNSLHDPQKSVRRASAEALAGFTNAIAPAATAITTSLTDPDPGVRERATNALLKIAPEYLTNAPPK